MTDYRKRSYEKELLDKDGLPFDDIRLNMQELNFINSHLGGHHITITGFKNLAAGKKTVSVCEIGCGGGDNLDAIYQWSVKNKLQTKFTGVDINPNCIAYAKEKTLIPGSRFIVSDYKTCELDTRNDILFSSLFCHHFHNHELVQMMKWMQHNSKLGFFINDLHRHPVAYYFIKLATQLFSSSYLVKNDAPLSVLRGFKKKEWKKILDQAGITGYNIKWKWAFRHLIVVKNHK
ncbi:MAG: methyltransferase domain-containing protein [Ginsengibacter sp.]